MPELPEVETVRRGLEPVMAGQVIATADVRRPDLRWPLPARMAERLQGGRVLRLGRRSKYLLIDLDRGETLIVHLGMSGRMLVSLPGDGRAATARFRHVHPAPEKHDHVILDMSGGARITFNDARRFGMMDLIATAAVASHRLLADLGPEPLGNSFDEDYLLSRLAGRRMPMKAALLDQRIVAGLGNIYVCEALWRAGISPLRKAENVAENRLRALVPHIRATLNDAIAAGGSSLRDYRQADGELGYFQHQFATYGREGRPCGRAACDGTIRRIAQSGRSTFYCPKCQR